MTTKFNIEDLNNVEFHIETKGYNCEQVDKFIDSVISDYKAMETRIKELETKANSTS